MSNNELIAAGFQVQTDYVGELDEESAIFCSIKAVTEEEKVKLFNIMNSPDHQLSDFVNMELEISDVVVESVSVRNDDGEEVVAPRIVLVDKDGVSYQCVSNGIYSALKKVFKIFGPPHWDSSKKFRVKQITKGKRNVLTLEMR